MEQPEFDSALRQVMERDSLPYEPLQWTQMAARLDAHANAQQPLSAGRVIPRYRWLRMAAAACVVAALLLVARRSLLPSNDKTDRLAAPPIAAQHPESLRKPAAPDNAMPTNHAVAGHSINKALLHLSSKSWMDTHPVAATAKEISAAHGTGPSAPAPQPADIAAAVITPATHSRINGTGLTGDEAHYAEPATRKTAVNLLGGYNFGHAKNNFTVGITVRRKLGSRLQLETGLALVSGGYATHHISSAPSGTPGMSIGTTPQYESGTNQLLYLQAAPSLSYRLYKGVSAGGGLDAQRLLSNPSQAVGLDNTGQEITRQPGWDFGLTGRMDIQLAKKLRAGVMYRESIRTIASHTDEAADRNYLLLQLSYAIF